MSSSGRAVAAGHLVADRQLAFHGHVHLDHLDHAGRQVVAAAQPGLALLEHRVVDADLLVGHVLDALDGLGEVLVFLDLDLLQLVPREVVELLALDLVALLGEPLQLVGRIEEILERRLADQEVLQLLVALHLDHRDLVLVVLLEPGDLFLLDRLRPLVLVDAAPREHLHVDHGALDAGRHGQRGVPYVPGLLAEDRAEQLLFRGQLRFALRRDLADENIAGLDLRADADDP
jgi:hypothetical protein